LNVLGITFPQNTQTVIDFRFHRVPTAKNAERR